MKNSALIFVLMFLLGPNVNAAQKIITYNAQNADEIFQTIKSQGGKVIKKYSVINAALVEVNDERGLDVRSVRGLKSVTDNEVHYWLDNNDFTLPSIKSVDFKIPDVPSKPAEVKTAPYADLDASWGVKRVNAQGAWSKDYSKVKVAVLDTGINFNHPDLKSAHDGYNAVSKGEPALDDHGHGTHVAGIIAALSNGQGSVGVVPGVDVYSVKVLSSSGSGANSYILDGLEWAINNKMDVVNMSLSSYWVGPISDMVKAAYKAGITMVAAAGNKGNQVRFPANMAETIAVSASDIQDNMAEFSCRGREIDVIAPGVDVYSTTKDGQWGNNSGTSMAAPHITGLAVLAIASGAKGPEAVRASLKNAAMPLPTIQYKEWQGSGMIDAVKIK